MNYKYNIGDRVIISEHLDTPESIFTYLSPIMREMSGNICRVRERAHDVFDDVNVYLLEGGGIYFWTEDMLIPVDVEGGTND